MKKPYDNHQLILAQPKDDYSKDALYNYIEKDVPDCEFLRAPRIHTQPLQVLCPSEDISSKLSNKLKSLNIKHDVWKGFSNSRKSISKRDTEPREESNSITDFIHYPR